MKKVISVFVVLIILSSMCLVGCGSSGGSDLNMVSSYMQDDDTVVVTFRNETGKTITYVRGSLNLFTGSSASQNAIKSPSFSWEGSCSKGSTFSVTVRVSNAPAGLANEVNRIGFHISEIG